MWGQNLYATWRALSLFERPANLKLPAVCLEVRALQISL
jgi:hypothetical protein